MDRLRVCHVITQLELGGAQKNVLDIVESLPQDRFETALVCGPGGMLDNEVCRRLGDRCTFVPSLVRQMSPLHDLLAFLSLRRIFSAGRYDIVHTHSSKAGVLGRLAAASTGVPLVVHTAHGWGFHDYQPAPVHGAFVAAERLSARFTDVLICEADVIVQKGLTAGVGFPHQYVVIPSGIDSAPYRAVSDVAAVRRRLGFDPNRPMAVMVACLKPQKAPLDFLEIASRVCSEIPGAQFVLAGDGDLRVAMEARLSKLGLQDSVKLLGWRHDVPDLLRASDLMLLTSRWEGLPQVFMAAIASGIPILATNVDAAPSVVQSGVNGYLFTPGDTLAMATCVVDLLRNPDKLRSLRCGSAASWNPAFESRQTVLSIARLYETHRRDATLAGV